MILIKAYDYNNIEFDISHNGKDYKLKINRLTYDLFDVDNYTIEEAAGGIILKSNELDLFVPEYDIDLNIND